MENWGKINDAKCKTAEYFVSDLGRIKSVRGSTETVKLGWLQHNGYLGVVFGHADRRNVHRLVAEYFCEKKDGCNVVNHLNGIKTDNRAVNLEWTTYEGNNRHAFESGVRTTFGKNHWSSIPEFKVIEIYSMKKSGKSIANISRELELNYGTVKCIFNGINWRHLYKQYFP